MEKTKTRLSEKDKLEMTIGFAIWCGKNGFDVFSVKERDGNLALVCFINAFYQKSQRELLNDFYVALVSTGLFNPDITVNDVGRFIKFEYVTRNTLFESVDDTFTFSLEFLDHIIDIKDEEKKQ